MTQEIQWGPAIAVDGKRPEWLGEDTRYQWRTFQNSIWRNGIAPWLYEEAGGWAYIYAIRLPEDHLHYGQTEAAPIDWSGELEAVHEDGRVVPVKFVIDEGGDELPVCVSPSLPSVGGGCAKWFNRDGTRPGWSGWRIRNVPQPTPQADTKPDLTARMEALVRRMNETGSLHYAKSCDPLFDEARAIVALLPEPVDPDEQYARDLIREQGWSGEREIGSEAVVVMIAKARRDALALAGEKEA